MINIEIWGSGKGSNAQNIISHFRSYDDINVSCLCTDRSGSGFFDIGKENGVDVLHLSKSYWESPGFYSDLKQRNPTLIVLAGFLKLVPKEVIQLFPDRIINVHPSLLPKYGGPGMYGDHVHGAVIAANELQSGISIHVVNENFDEGKVLAQFTTSVDNHLDVDGLKAKISQLEMHYFPMVIRHYSSLISGS